MIGFCHGCSRGWGGGGGNGVCVSVCLEGTLNRVLECPFFWLLPQVCSVCSHFRFLFLVFRFCYRCSRVGGGFRLRAGLHFFVLYSGSTRGIQGSSYVGEP